MKDGSCAAGRRSKAPLLWPVLCTALLWAAPSEAIDRPRPPIEILHADSVSLERTQAGDVYYAFGSTHFRQGQTELWADKAVRYQAQAEIHLFGHVRLRDTAETLNTDTLRYYSETDRAFAFGHVEYGRPASDLKAIADRGEYDRSARRAKLYDNARMIYRDSDLEGRSETWADTLWIYPDSDSGAAQGHVRVLRRNGEATAARAVFTTRPEADLLTFTGQPEGTFHNNNVAADTLVLEIRNDELDRLLARGNARAVFRESSAESGRATESEINSKRMDLIFGSGELRELVAEGEAESRYVPAWGRPGERNDASGDTVKISIADSTVHRVQVVGGARGTYYAPRGDSDSTGLDTIVYASSYIDYRVDRAAIRLWDHAEITYGEVTLNAGQVLYTTDSAVLRAYALQDTLMPPPADYRDAGPPSGPTPDSNVGGDPVPKADAKADTLDRVESESDAEPRQRPVLRDRTQEIRGQRLVYDIKSQRGRITQSSTEAQDGYYHGENFRKERERTYYVEHGRFTTCELECPHFQFAGSRMKIVERDRVVARPIVLSIERLPVLWVPYYVFSIQPGRHSGMLPLRFGNFNRGSRYVRNIGYYFAVSDYFDFTPSLDIVEGQGLLWQLRASYTLRYLMRGNLFGSYNRHTRATRDGDERTTRWNLIFNHYHQITPTLTLSGSGNFVSDNSFYQDFTADPDVRLNRTLRSQVNINKRWSSTSLVVALDDNRNLDADSRTSILPRFTLTAPARQIFTPRRLKGGKTEPSRWYHNFRAGYSSNGQNLQRTYQDTVAAKNPDTTIDKTKDTVRVEQGYATWDHSLSFSYSDKLLGVLSLTPSLNIQETWYYVFDPTNFELPAGVEANRVYRRLAGSFAVSSQTNLYGIFPINRGGLLGFRHVFTPSVSFSMSPAITQNDAVRLYTGKGGGSRLRSRNLRIGIANLFQMKTQQEDREKLWELLNVSSSASYNFEAATRKWSNINTSIRTGLLRNPDISISLVHDPYDPVSGEFDWTPRLTNISTSLTLRLSGRGGTSASADPAQGGYYEAMGGSGLNAPALGGGGFTGRKGWNFSASYRFSESRGTGGSSITHWVQPNLSFQPTPHWDVQTNLYYDIFNQKMNDWTIRVHRDLHCWEGEFSWIVTGPRAGYYFKINVVRLGDLKFEKSESGLRDALFGTLANP